MSNGLIFTEGSKSIGMGHVNRACLIRDFFKKKFHMPFNLVINDDSQAKQFLVKRSYAPECIIKTCAGGERAAILSGILEHEQPLVLVVDVLWEDAMQACITAARTQGCRTVVIIDNTERKEVNSDFVINGNPSQLDYDYSGLLNQYLVGPDYFIMDEAYAWTEVPRPRGTIQKILVTVGGSDHNDLLFRVLAALGEIRDDLSALVAVSASSGYLDKLYSFMEHLPIRCELAVDAPKLVKLWDMCDAAITAGGNSLFERIAVRIPGATVCQLERQMEIADRFERMGVNCNLGFGPTLSDASLKENMSRFLLDADGHQRQYAKAKNIIDGRGLMRIGEHVMKSWEKN